MGRLTEDKGVTDLLDAWKEAEAGLDLQIIGDGPLLPLVESSRLRNLSATGALSREEVRTRMLAARALVLPSRWFEGLPMVLVEALSCGLPVIIPGHGALPDVAGDAGLPFAPGSPRDLIRAIRALQDNDLVEMKSASARHTYREHYNPAADLTRLTRIYERATENMATLESRP